MTIDGLAVDAAEFEGAIHQSDEDAVYSYLVTLLDGDTTVKGSRFDDKLEVGEGGKAIVKAGAGDDRLYVWHQKTIDYDGGGGGDWINFTYQRGFQPSPATGAIVDLTTGTGTNSFGGSLKLRDVENVAGEFGARNVLRGNSADNILQGGTKADSLKGEGGDDTIAIKYHDAAAERAVRADGGAGVDTLRAELSYGPAAPTVTVGGSVVFRNILDLEKPGENTGSFHGGTFKSFESFAVTGDGFTQFHFFGAGGSQTVKGLSGADLLDGRGGDDVLIGQGGGDSLRGGAGSDTASYETYLFGLTASLAKPSANTGQAQGNRYVSIENLTGSLGDDTLDGNGGTNTLCGGRGADTLDGKGGADLYRYETLADSPAAGRGRDLIERFSQRQNDRIDLHLMDADTRAGGNQAFRFIGDDPFGRDAGELRAVRKGGDTLVSGDVDGNGKADFSILIDGPFTLQRGDFIL